MCSLKLTRGLMVLTLTAFLAAPLPATWAQCQRAKVAPSDGAPGDFYGLTVGVSSGTAVVGALGDDDNGPGSGSAYVFEAEPNGTWLQAAKLTPDDGAEYDFFGTAVAISADLIVIGAYYDDDLGTRSGSAYVFERAPNGVWSQSAKLLADDGGEYELFGSAVAISEEFLVVGAPHDDDNGGESGSAYVFERALNGVWSQAAKLLGGDGQGGDHFAYAVAIDGDIVVIGAPDDDDLGNWSGSAYVFERDPNGPWRQVAKLLPSDGGAFWSFGCSVAVSGARVLVGAETAQAFAPSAGAAYIFERRADGQWPEAAQIVSEDIENSDVFGASVSLSGDVAVIGAWGDDDYGQQTGAAYVFLFEQGTGWSQVGKLLAEDGAAHDRFGKAVAVSGNSAVIGAYLDDDQGEDSGSAYIFAVGPDEDGNGIMDVCESSPGTPTQAPKGRQGLGAGRQSRASKALP